MKDQFPDHYFVPEVVDSPPSGCAIVTVNDKITAHLVLKGLVDPGKEIEKLTKKRAVLQQTMEKLLKAVKVPGKIFFMCYK